MLGALRFLRCVGKAVVKHGLRALAGLVPMGDSLYDIASDAWVEYNRENVDEQLRAEIQSLAQASPAQAKQAAEAVVRQVAADQPPNVQQALTSYLTQVPATVRQSLRRPADPTGTTAPATLSLRKPEELLPFLPQRLPRFKPGDRPLAPVPWELVGLLGVGGFGEVWKARHLTLASRPPVALKFCLDGRAAGALRNEADLLDRVMQQGRHPGIVPLLQTYLDADPPCLEYEYVEGGDLSGLMQDLAASGGATPDYAAQLIRGLARSIAFAHRLNPPIVHRDLKPANVLMQRMGDGKVVLRIADFGIGGVAAARVIHQETSQPTTQQQTMPTAIRGAYTPLYASPQQRRGDQPDPRDDVHALGVIWHQLLAGDLTAERPGGRGWRKKLEARGMAPGLIDLLESCIDDEPWERPQDADELAKRIARLIGLAPVGVARPAPVTPQPEHPAKTSDNRGHSWAESWSSDLGAASVAAAPQPARPDAPPREMNNSLGMALVLVPRGTFWMGDRGKQKQVEVPHDFYIGTLPVTQEQWQAVMGNNPSYFSRCGRGADKVKGFSDADLKQFPVEQVSWDDVQEFLKRLNASEKDSCFLYRLPTEAEWEYACRGGATSEKDCAFDFYFAQPANDLSSNQANFDGNHPVENAPKGKYLERTTKVGSYQPNRLGIYDMHGNVWEWCEGHFETRGPARVIRGGSWGSSAAYCRAALRNGHEPAYRNELLGFRLAAVQPDE
jgi:formylglycine-generating enzyme required for sulfatase activity